MRGCDGSAVTLAQENADASPRRAGAGLPGVRDATTAHNRPYGRNLHGLGLESAHNRPYGRNLHGARPQSAHDRPYGRADETDGALGSDDYSEQAEYCA